MVRHLFILGLAACCTISVTTAEANDAPVPTSDTMRACSTSNTNVHCFAQPLVDQYGKVFATAGGPSYGYAPADIQAAYNIDPNQPTDATVAVIDAFDDTNAESDLATYRAFFGLPPCTTANGCFRQVNQSGHASPLPPPPPANDDWTTETSLDLDAVSSGCPHCKILLIEANDDLSIPDSYGINLAAAQDTAAALGATVISNSWGTGWFGEFEGEQLVDSTYFNQPGVAIFASAGDDGYSVAYPAVSPNVIAVGGTSLQRDASNPRGFSETVWTGSGSGCSTHETKPSWQSGIDTGCSNRAMNDVAAVADPYTGLAVYDTANGNAGWMVIGGTSLSSPLTAAIFAGSGNGGVKSDFIYAHTSAFYDITSGSDGNCSPAILCNAGPGWDGPTGVGTPNAVSLTALAQGTTAPATGGGGCSLGNLLNGFGQLSVIVPWQAFRRRRRPSSSTIESNTEAV